MNNLNITWAVSSNLTTTITFDPVTATKIRLDMTSPNPYTNTAFMQITELQVMANQVTYNTTAQAYHLG